ncbi:MAG: right-handed parallel beta-helix repeat-containing protein [Terriglobales bacterium]
MALATVIFLSLLLPGTAYALSCGDTITVSTTLQANLGPCSGVALTVGKNGITLRMNGWSIIASNDPSNPGVEGVNVGGTTNVSIKGPGTITGFTYGISVFDANGNRTPSSNTKVSHVHFVANAWDAVAFVGGSGNQVLDSTFIANPCIAIKFDTVANGKIIGNAITGSNAPPTGNNCSWQESGIGGGVGISIASTSPGAIVKDNSVTNSTNGLWVDSGASLLTLTGNDFSGNTQDGIDVMSQVTMASNQVNGNGRNGITLAYASGSLVHLNTANSNGANGIGLGGLLGFTSGNSDTITANLALGNTLDLYFDGVGTGNAFPNNICDMESTTIGYSCH